jgi:hypothetical protein
MNRHIGTVALAFAGLAAVKPLVALAMRPPAQATGLVCTVSDNEAYLFFMNNVPAVAANWTLVHTRDGVATDVAGSADLDATGDERHISFVHATNSGATAPAYSMRLSRATSDSPSIRIQAQGDSAVDAVCAMRTLAVTPSANANAGSLSGILCTHEKNGQPQHILIVYGAPVSSPGKVDSAILLGYPQDPETAPSPNAFTPPYLGLRITHDGGGTDFMFRTTSPAGGGRPYHFDHMIEVDALTVSGLHYLGMDAPIETECTKIAIPF